MNKTKLEEAMRKAYALGWDNAISFVEAHRGLPLKSDVEMFDERTAKLQQLIDKFTEEK